MQIFNYTAKDFSNERHKGRVEARSESHAVEILRSKGLVVTGISPVIEGGLTGYIENMFGSVKNQELVAFTRQLATMINSGLPINDALSILQAQSKPKMSQAIGEIIRDIQGGSGFGEALDKHSQIFSKVYISLVKSGEVAGKLDEVLNRLADSEEKRREFKQKTQGAMIYPAIVMIGMVIVVFVMMVFVIPKLTDMYDEFGADLPFVTQLLISISTFMQNFWYIIIMGVFGLIYGVQAWKKTPKGRETIDRFMLSMPVMGPLRTQIALAEFSRTLALLVGSGISILEALEVVSDSSDNVIFEKAIKESSKGVEKGLPLAVMLARQPVFPMLISQMVSVGEETGEMDDVLLKVAMYFERESEHMIKNLTTALEPLIMIVLGVGVGFIVIAIVMPLYNLTNQF